MPTIRELRKGIIEQVDAGIVVLSVDPPITEVESHFLRRHQGRDSQAVFRLEQDRSSFG